jgi:hypothetical protein
MFMLSLRQVLGYIGYKAPHINNHTGFYIASCEERVSADPGPNPNILDNRRHLYYLQAHVENGFAYTFYVKIGFSLNTLIQTISLFGLQERMSRQSFLICL